MVRIGYWPEYNSQSHDLLHCKHLVFLRIDRSESLKDISCESNSKACEMLANGEVKQT